MNYTAEFILNCKKPGDLFSNNKNSCKDEYRDLAKQWHPDKNPNADVKIFQHITALYTSALKLINSNTWEASNFIAVKTKSGSTVGVKFYKAYSFELGTAYVCERFVVYEFEASHRKYYENALRRIKAIVYSDSRLKDTFEQSMPKVLNNFESVTDKLYIVIAKPKNIYPLSEVLKQFNNIQTPDKHVAWMTTRLLNICCFLGVQKLVHNGISIDNIFVDTDAHRVILLGG